MGDGLDRLGEMAVVTPESVSFSYRVAGIGSRFLALSIDHLLAGSVLAGVTIAIGLSGARLDRWLAVLLTAGGYLFFFIIYFILFELLWGGQTPGKRLLHLRVIRVGGYALTPTASILRNLLRAIDFLPFAYGLGLLAVFVSGRSRLGDLAAGTVVIEDRPAVPPGGRQAGCASALADLDAEMQAVLRNGIRFFTPRELYVMRDFLRRRTRLGSQVRASLAARLNEVVLARVPALAATGRFPPDGENLLEAVVAADAEAGPLYLG